MSGFDPEGLRRRALEILRREARPLSSGELAMLLGEPAHRVPIAMDQPLQAGLVRYTNVAAWELVDRTPAPAAGDSTQESLA